MQVNTSQVQIPNNDLLIDAYLAQPEGNDKKGAVIVFQEIFGVNNNIRDITKLIAEQGYIAIAPALYQRIAPGFEFGFSAEDKGFSQEAYRLGLEYYQQVKYQELFSDIKATIAYLKNLDNVKADSIGCIGFCFGGHVAYMAATLPDIKATASFYGGGITQPSYGEDIPTVHRTSEIQGTIYTFFGTKDNLISQSDTEQIEAELNKHNVNHRVFRYDAGHGFFGGFFVDEYPFLAQNPAINREAAMDAWNHVLELFENNL
ncbi:MAG: dienelactone hydrolase family protein [Rivularia sp. (in: Bacteria)]|nr:dienelactone hydrolase family protein [Rivularia sp. MS3]